MPRFLAAREQPEINRPRLVRLPTLFGITWRDWPDYSR